MSMIGNFRLARPDDIERLLGDPERITDFLYNEEVAADRLLDIDKAWHGLHFLLTGTAWEGTPPWNFIVSGGHPIGQVDVGYGPARAFSNAELQAIAAALAPLPIDELRSRFDPKKMQELEIYPSIWDRPPAQDDTLGYLIERYQALKAFVAQGAAEGFGLIVYLN